LFKKTNEMLIFKKTNKVTSIEVADDVVRVSFTRWKRGEGDERAA